MCGASQRQYGLGQKQGKTLVISRLPSGGTGRYAACREQAEKQRPASSRPVLNDELLTEPLRQPLTYQACENVGWTAGGKADNNMAACSAASRDYVFGDPEL
jgi:hypothetical protein